VVEAKDVKVWFPQGGGLFAPAKTLRAVDGVSLAVREGETLGVVGESGSGKSTLARAILRLLPTQGGAVSLLGRDLTLADQQALRRARREMQVVFQDPLASLDPRMTIGESAAEPLRAFRPAMSRAEREAAVAEMLGEVGLRPE